MPQLPAATVRLKVSAQLRIPVVVATSPPMLTSNGKWEAYPAVSTHRGYSVARSVRTHAVVAVLVRSVTSDDPSVSARDTSGSSSTPTVYGLAGVQLNANAHVYCDRVSV